jgi:rubrerythrin
MSIQIEQGGESFYRAAAGNVEENRIGKSLNKLANDERRHAEIFRSLSPHGLEEETKGMLPEETRPYIESLVGSSVLRYLVSGKELVAEAKTLSEVLDFALGFEKESLLFYYSIRDYLASRSLTPRLCSCPNDA